ncbi:pentatricopeptide repeat-containing protein At5g57250, mitochondrial [Brachypodium distachyon]|nr:pentatricopeptide repeat-containing protein At5g57250, mitochondrial [Brachypodium distachyon]XP_010230743.2 pentatricopeptide repeat-containing protein At5g57250, mitochondrial [Brachypodium distachyon]XP_014754719.1 pentatricopeptide repeat-containing protein At5g57250, mitochondrial [Brachypodium distachyon]XP_024314243.1 pentatricopeptide repeat-containing protein At5g57250, mitochondrial [Brachypodium distachyon]XP_024314244.1 pentatricopeptide repeat-containing protein At5g57250, mitoc|eukprot:XP_003565620.3 pentatricopeptide repeat-containing protein At5g57250, mitochondrial [Brachypodium distachyon]
MGFPGGKPPTPPLPSLIKLGHAISARHVDQLLAALLRCHRHRLVGALVSQALFNSLRPTPRTHLLAASALLASARPRDAARRLALAGPASSTRCLWDALLRWTCAEHGDPRHALELLSAGVEDHGAVLSPSTYHAMVSVLSDRGDMAGALKVFGIMTERGCQVDDRVCSAIVSGFSKAGNDKAGLEFYDRVRKEVCGFEPGLMTLTAVVNLLGREGKIGEVAELVSEMEQKGMIGDAVFYSSLVHGYMTGGLLMEGLREHRLMLDKGIAADVVNYTTVIDGMCREGSVDKVMGFLDEMERSGAKPNLITYTSLVGGFCKRNRLEDAFSVVRKLEQKGVVVDEYVYSILIDSLCKMGDLDKAFCLLGEMEGKGIKAGTVTYNTVIDGLCKAGDTNNAIEISQGVAADNFTYSMLLHGCIKGEDSTGIMAIKSRLESSGIAVDVVTCNILIKALFMVNKMDDACSLFHRMRDMGLSPNTVTYHTIINMMCKLGDIGRAVELFDEYKKDKSLSGTAVHNVLIGALCNGGKVNIAEQIFYDLIHKKLRPDSCTYRKLIHANFKEGGEQGVLNFIRKLEGLEMNLLSSICNYASTFLSTKDCCEAALHVYKMLRVQAFPVTSKTFYKLLKSLLRNGYDQVIQPLLSEFTKIHGLNEPRMINMLSCHLSKKNVGAAIRFSSYMDNCSVPVSVLRGAVYALKKEGEILDAYNFLEQAEQSGFSVDLAMYSIVVEGLCRGGYLEKALDLCETMQKEGIHPTIIVHNSVLSGLCQHGCFTEAFRLFDYLESSNILPTIITYAILIGALCREGFLDDAYQLIQKMSNKGIRPTTRVYNLLISGYCNYGLTEKALGLMSHFEEHFLLPDAFTLGSVINGHCLKGNTEAALGFFNEYHCKEMVPDFVGFMSLVKGLYAKGRMEESRGILREMFQCKEIVDLINSVGNEVQTESLVALLSSACEEGRIDEVVTILNEVGLMSVSSSDSSNCNTLAQLKKLQRIDNASDPGTDSGQVLSSVSFDVSSDCFNGSYKGRLQTMIERADNISTTSDDTDIENGNLLGKSFYDDFDTYYPAIASLCSKGEFLKANNAIEAMIQNSG